MQRIILIALFSILFTSSVSAEGIKYSGSNIDIIYNGEPLSIETNTRVGTSVTVTNKGESSTFTFTTKDVISNNGSLELVTIEDLSQSLAVSSMVRGFDGTYTLGKGESITVPLQVDIPAGVNKSLYVGFEISSEVTSANSIVEVVTVPEEFRSEYPVAEVMSLSFNDANGTLDGNLFNQTNYDLNGVVSIKLVDSDSKEYLTSMTLEHLLPLTHNKISISFSESIPKGTYQIEAKFISGDVQITKQLEDTTGGISSRDESNDSLIFEIVLISLAFIIIIGYGLYRILTRFKVGSR